MNIIDIILQLPDKLSQLTNTLLVFLFEEITIGDITVSLWGLLGGGLIVLLIVLSIIGAIRG